VIFQDFEKSNEKIYPDCKVLVDWCPCINGAQCHLEKIAVSDVKLQGGYCTPKRE
jgi:hypothetical protein